MSDAVVPWETIHLMTGLSCGQRAALPRDLRKYSLWLRMSRRLTLKSLICRNSRSKLPSLTSHKRKEDIHGRSRLWKHSRPRHFRWKSSLKKAKTLLKSRDLLIRSSLSCAKNKHRLIRPWLSRIAGRIIWSLDRHLLTPIGLTRNEKT